MWECGCCQGDLRRPSGRLPVSLCESGDLLVPPGGVSVGEGRVQRVLDQNQPLLQGLFSENKNISNSCSVPRLT